MSTFRSLFIQFILYSTQQYLYYKTVWFGTIILNIAFSMIKNENECHCQKFAAQMPKLKEIPLALYESSQALLPQLRKLLVP